MTLDSEPSPDQVSGMTERVNTLDLEPYADFSLFTPYGRRLQKQLKLKNWVMNQDGTYHPQEVPGPQDFEAWYACWRVYANVLLMITKTLTIAGQEVKRAIMTVAALEVYLEAFRKLVKAYPECWHLCAIAEDRCRGEHFPRLRRVLKDKHAKGQAPDFDVNLPWIAVMSAAAEDDRYWDEQVRRPAIDFLARGGSRGQKRPASEALEEPLDTPPKSKRQKKRERKEAVAEAKKQLVKDWEASPKMSKGDGKGKAAGKGKGKEQGEHPRRDSQGRYVTTREGTQICFGFQMGKCKGPCQQQRAHVCQICLQGHRTSDCTTKKNNY